IRLRLWLFAGIDKNKQDTVLAVMSPSDRADALCERVREFYDGPIAVLEPRGTGPQSWNTSQDWMITRAALLAGRTPESVRVWDIVQGTETLRNIRSQSS